MNITETNVTLMVKDMDKAISFYQSLGLTIKNRWDNHYAQLTTKDIIIGLHPASGEIKPSTQVSIGFVIDDLDGAKALLDSQQIIYTTASDKAGVFLSFHDPDGTTLYFNLPSWK